MYTEGKNLIINSPPAGDVVCNGESFNKLVAEVKALRAAMAEIKEQLDSRGA